MDLISMFQRKRKRGREGERTGGRLGDERKKESKRKIEEKKRNEKTKKQKQQMSKGIASQSRAAESESADLSAPRWECGERGARRGDYRDIRGKTLHLHLKPPAEPQAQAEAPAADGCCKTFPAAQQLFETTGSLTA